MILNGFAALGLAYSGCHVIWAVFFLSLSLALHGAVSTGALASIVDISPNYAGVILGLMSTLTIMSGFISPVIVAQITFENQSIVAWQHIFEICAFMLITCGTIYILFIDSTVQEWNKPPKKIKEPEMEPLNFGMNSPTQNGENDKKVIGITHEDPNKLRENT